MTALARIAAFVALLAGVFVISYWVGQAYGPNPEVAVPQHESTSEIPHGGTAR